MFCLLPRKLAPLQIAGFHGWRYSPPRSAVETAVIQQECVTERPENDKEKHFPLYDGTRDMQRGLWISTQERPSRR